MKTALKTVALVGALLLVTAIPAWAGQGVGTSPYAASLLVSGLNTGELEPGQEYWYAYSRTDLGDPEYNAVILSLNFEAEGRAIASRVNFQVFSFEQVDAWLRDSSGPVDNLGLGAAASADFDADTGERFWAGPLAPSEVYYVRIFNLSPSPVRFRLTALGQKSSQIDAFMTFDQNSTPSEAAIPAAMSVPAQTETEPALAPDLPLPAAGGSSASTSWLLAAQAINGLPPNEAAAWLMSAARLGWLPTGSGSEAAAPVKPDIDAAPGLAPGDGGSSDVTGVAVPAPPDPMVGESIYPSQPVRLLEGTNTGRLAPKSEHWYTFTAGKILGKTIENYSLTMFFTPGEPNLARDVTFEMYTADQYPIWERGTPDQMEHFGAGSWVSRDGDYNTGERLWHGTVVHGGIYFVKIINETNKWVDYHLMTGDIYNTELGLPTEKPKKVAAETAPTGRDIGSPLPVDKGLTSGRLSAGQEIWYSFEDKNFASDEYEFTNYLIQLDHTPGAGYVTNYVNFEIYPFQEQQLWRRGDTGAITPLGAGSDAAYDKASDTHTWLWDGHFVSNTIYFIRVRNDSVTDIDYELLIRRR